MTTKEIKISKENIFLPYLNDKSDKIIDRNPFTKWSGAQLPTYIDIRFKKWVQIEKIDLTFSRNSFCLFDVFYSEDDANYSLIYSQNSESIKKDGKYQLDLNFSCTSIRLLIKYNSRSPKAQVKDIHFFGKDIDKKFEPVTADFVCDFEKSEYNRTVTVEDTIEELYAIVERTVGKKYVKWFTFEIEDADEEYYELSDCDEKIKIRANNGVNAAVGLNYYYKYFCFVNISQVGNRVKMPENTPKIGGKLYFKTPFKVRYSYNYCTLSYTMAFWKEQQWQRELDWLALEGVNVVLDITAQEEVWRRFLMKIGYSLDEAKAFITGPAYYAWFNMANIFGVGGPVPNEFFKDRTNLARKNHLFMQKMGMKPVLQGYMGMVPTDIKNIYLT